MRDDLSGSCVTTAQRPRVEGVRMPTRVVDGDRFPRLAEKGRYDLKIGLRRRYSKYSPIYFTNLILHFDAM